MAVTRGPSSSSSGSSPASFRDLLDRHIIASVYKQLHLADIVGDRSCKYSGGSRGAFFIGEDLAFGAELLGAECAKSKTFAWGAEPRGSGGAEVAGLLQALRTGRGWCDGSPPAEFTDATVSLADASGEQIGAVASGVLGAAAYQLLPPGPRGSAQLVIIKDPQFPERSPETAGDALRVSLAIQQALALGWIKNDALAIDSFMRSRNWDVLTDGDLRTYTLQGSTSYIMEFDRQGKLKQMETSLMPA